MRVVQCLLWNESGWFLTNSTMLDSRLFSHISYSLYHRYSFISKLMLSIFVAHTLGAVPTRSVKFSLYLWGHEPMPGVIRY